MATKKQPAQTPKKRVIAPSAKGAAAQKLRDKQILFVEHYLQTWNAAEAARRAGYGVTNDSNDETIASIGRENLRKPAIRARIDARLKEAGMSADEVLARLTEQARGSVEDFIDAKGNIDLAQAKQRRSLHNVKKITQKTRYVGEVKEVEIQLELHDSQGALEKLARHHQLFTDKLKVNVDGELKIDDSREQLARLIAGIADRDPAATGDQPTDASPSEGTTS